MYGKLETLLSLRVKRRMSSGLFASASFGPTPRLRRPTTGSNAAHEPHFIGNPTQELSNSSCLCEDLHEPRSSSIMLAKCACSNRAEDIFSPTCKANSLIDAFFNVKLVSTLRSRVKTKVTPLLAQKGSSSIKPALQRVCHLSRLALKYATKQRTGHC